MCIDGKLNFNEHVHGICSKASAQISALQRLTGLVDYQRRKAIYTSFIASNFNYCPLVWFFTSTESTNKINKIQERVLRFVLKDHTSSYNDLLLKSGFDSFRIYAVKPLMTELFKISEGMAPDYLSELFVKADNPYDTRDKCKLIQPLKRSTTYGLRSFQYYGAHVWIMLPINIKAAQSLYEFKSFMARADMFMSDLHCIIIRNVTLVYWTPVCRCDGFVVACGTGGWLRGSSRCHRRLLGRHYDNVNNQWIQFRHVIDTQALSVWWGFRHRRHWRFSVMKISSAASGASFASRVFLFVFIIGILRCLIFLLWTLHLVLSFEYTCLCRCGVSVVACGTVGCLCDNPRGAGSYQIVTMTMLFPVFDKSSTSLRRNCCRFGGVFVADCTKNCQAGNPIAVGCGNCVEMAFLSVFRFGNNLWAFWWVRILIP